MMPRTRRGAWALAALMALAAAAPPASGSNQAPPGQPPPPQQAGAQPPPAAGQPSAPPPTEAYTYNPEGRRDPFVSLLSRGSDLRPGGSRPAGLAGVLINEVIVRGIVRGKSGYLAMVQAPDNRTYIVHPDDRLMDGTVTSIVETAVVFSQEVNDPLSLVKQREVRKSLRTLQEGK